MGGRRFRGERSRPPSGGRIPPRRSPGRRTSTPSRRQITCNAAVIKKAGRLAAEYFVYKGLIPAGVLSESRENPMPPPPPPPPERRASSPRGEDRDGRRRRFRDEQGPRKRSRERRDDDDDSRRRGSESGDSGRKRGRDKLWAKRGRGYSENADSEDDLSPGVRRRRGRFRDERPARSDVSGDSGTGKDRDLADGVRGHANGRSEGRGKRQGRDEDRRGSMRDKEEVIQGRSSKVSTKHWSSAGRRSPKSSQRRVIESSSSNSHANRANGSKLLTLEDLYLQSVKPVDESINPQDESCRTSQGLKETVAVVDASELDNSTHFDKREEINRGGDSSPPKVSQTNELSTRGLKETVVMVGANEFDTSAHFDKREEIDKGGASYLPKVSQTNGHSPMINLDVPQVDVERQVTHRSPEANRGKAAESFSSDPSAKLANASDSSHVQSVESTDSSINPQDESRRSSRGLKEDFMMVDVSEHDTSAHIDKEEEIDKGRASSLLLVSQMDEHSPLPNIKAPQVDEERWAGRRSLEANRGRVTESFSSDPLANLANMPKSCHIQSVESMDKSMNPQDESRQSSRGLKETVVMVDVGEHDTSAHIDKKEEIDEGRNSSPLEVYQMNEHSPLSNLNVPQVDEERWVASRSPEDNRGKVTEIFSSDPLTNLANALESSHIQSVESMGKSINLQDESCRSLRGLKEEAVVMVDVSEHDSYAHIDKEEIEGRVLSPPEVSQTNEHSPLSNLDAPQVDEERWVVRRSPESNRRKVTESFSGDPLANLANAPERSHIQSVKSMDISINSQDESCRSLLGLKGTVMTMDVKEHDTSAHFDKEEIDKGRASYSTEVSQTNEHFPLSNLNVPPVIEERCAAQRIPEANRGKVVESFSSDSLANISKAPDSSHVQSVDFTYKSINPQDESCQTLQGLKETVVMVGVREDDTSPHFDEKEDINRGSVSSPVKVSKANEHSALHKLGGPQSDKEIIETFNQEQPSGHDVMPKCGSEYVVKVEEEKHLEPVSYKICDLNLAVSPEMNETPSDFFWRNDEPTSVTLVTKENVSVDFGLRASNSIGNGHDSFWVSSNGEVIPVINLDNDSEAEDDACGSSKPKSEALYSSAGNARNHMPPRDGTPGGCDGCSPDIPELLGGDISRRPSIHEDLNKQPNEMSLHGTEEFFW